MRKILLLLSLCMLTIHSTHNIHAENGPAKNIGVGVIAGLAAGGAAFGVTTALKTFGEGSSGKRLLASGAAGLLAGGLAYFAMNYNSAKDRDDVDNYVRAVKFFEEVCSSSLMIVPLESFIEFITEHYDASGPFASALDGINFLQDKLNSAFACVEHLLLHTNGSRDSKKVHLREKAKVLREKINVLYNELLRRKTIISNEYIYEEAVNTLLVTRQSVEEIVQSEQLVAVKDSYEKTVAYGISMVDELWPLVIIVKELRDTVQNMSNILKSCVAQREVCVQANMQDDRYRKLVSGYNNLISRIKIEFPFDLFEKRIRQIFSSPQYQAQGELLERHKQHEETMKVLHGMQRSLESALGEMKKTLAAVESNTSRVSSRLHDVESKLGSLTSKMSDIMWGVSSLRSDVASIKNSVSRDFTPNL